MKPKKPIPELGTSPFAPVELVDAETLSAARIAGGPGHDQKGQEAEEHETGFEEGTGEIANRSAGGGNDTPAPRRNQEGRQGKPRNKGRHCGDRGDTAGMTCYNYSFYPIS
jgi:hypothetical protein